MYHILLFVVLEFNEKVISEISVYVCMCVKCEVLLIIFFGC